MTLFSGTFVMQLDSLPDPSPAPARPVLRPSRGRWPWWLAGLSLLAALGWFSQPYWPERSPPLEADIDLSPEALDRRLLGTESAMASLKRSQQTIDQRLADTRARTDLLRDEVLGIGQRSAIIEDNLRELAKATAESHDVLRLDEAELLLGLAQTRLRIAGDQAGAVQATALAEAALAALTDPQWVSLRQTLADELAALHSLPADPRLQAEQVLAALEAALPQLAAPASAGAATAAVTRSGFQRLLDALIQIRPSGSQDLLAPSERATGEAALALELALARTAIEQRDDPRFRASLARIGHWLSRLYVDSPLLKEQHAQLERLASRPLTPQWPALGRTLEQLRELRRPNRNRP